MSDSGTIHPFARLAGLLRAGLRPPDTVNIRETLAAERLIAVVRLLVVAVILLMPLIYWLEGNPINEPHTTLPYILGVLAISLAVLWWILRVRFHPALPFLSTLLDVSLVTGALITFWLSGSPDTAVNSRVIWGVYLLAILVTTVRGDARATWLAGVVAALQYLALVIGVVAFSPIEPGQIIRPEYGAFSWADQVARLALIMLATVVASAIIQRNQRLIHRAHLDPLTGLHNRSHLDEHLPLAVDQAREQDKRLAVAMIDIDDFKGANDEHGHPAGDACLKYLTRQLKGRMGPSAIVARFGGDEFAVVRNGASADELAAELESIRQWMEANGPDWQGRQLEISFSAGVSALPEDGVSALELLNVADGRLMRAKAAGRNRVVEEA